MGALGSLFIQADAAPRGRLTQALDFTGDIAVTRIIVILCALALGACASRPPAAPIASSASLAAAEIAFAKSMADRDLEEFSSFIHNDAVFINGGKPLRGKPQILAHWKRFFEKPEAPFSWKPEIAEVSTSTGLGYTEGPVSISNGRIIARFYSTWQLQKDGSWQVVFDNGYDVCNCESTP